MDPVSALGVAAASIQFLDFSIKLLRTTKQISASASGHTKNQTSILGIATRLDSMVQDQTQSLKRIHDEPVTPARAGLCDICHQCHEKAQELQDAVREITATRKTPKSWGSFWAALKGVISDPKLRSLLAGLEALRTELHTTLLLCLWDESKHSHKAIGNMQQKVDTLVDMLSRNEHAEKKAPQRTRVTGLNDKSVHHRMLGNEIAKILWDERWEHRLAEESQTNGGNSIPADIGAVRTITNSLLFDDFEKRHEKIPEAHKNTLRWIWEQEPPLLSDGLPKWSSFPAWLEAENAPFYSIIGKPGSGKSTLMKYIQQHQKLEAHLRSWSSHLGESNRGHEGEVPARVLSFYAWNPGSGLQNSLDGLRRTMLINGLYQDPSLLPKVTPVRWAFHEITRGMTCPRAWSPSEIAWSLSLFMAEHAAKVKLLLLIDGLDEFSTPPKDILDFISSISQQAAGRVKICVACRPWNEFKDYFLKFPSLTMQNLTQQDLKLYVSDMFNASPASHERKDEAENLQATVIARCEGVFLWVSVVTNFILESMQRGDTEAELKVVVKNLPSEMTELYDNIWDRVPQSYRDSALRIFLLLEASRRQTLLFLELWVVDETYGQSWTEPRLDINPVVLERLKNTISRRLQSRTHGLLEILPDHTIGYLHRTGHEWRMQQKLGSQYEQEYQPHSALLDAFFFLAKCYPYKTPPSNMTALNNVDLQQYIVDCVLFHAPRVSVDARLTPAQQAVLGTRLLEFSEISNTWEATLGHPVFPSWYRKKNIRRKDLAPCFIEVAACLGLTPLFTILFKGKKQKDYLEAILSGTILPPERRMMQSLCLESYKEHPYFSCTLFSRANRLEIIRLCIDSSMATELASNQFKSIRMDVENHVKHNLNVDEEPDEVLRSYFREVINTLRGAEARVPAGKWNIMMNKLETSVRNFWLR